LKLRHLSAGLLAVGSDAWGLGVAIVSLVCNLLVTVFLWRNRETREDRREAEARQHELVAKLVDERFRAMTHEVNGHVNGLSLALEELKHKLKEGESVFGRLGDRDQKIELTVAARIDALKDYIRDNAASKKDLEKHEAAVERKFTSFEARIGDLTSGVAVLTERVGDGQR
jgi:hypothetical protein